MRKPILHRPIFQKRFYNHKEFMEKQTEQNSITLSTLYLNEIESKAAPSVSWTILDENVPSVQEMLALHLWNILEPTVLLFSLNLVDTKYISLQAQESKTDWQAPWLRVFIWGSQRLTISNPCIRQEETVWDWEYD